MFSGPSKSWVDLSLPVTDKSTSVWGASRADGDHRPRLIVKEAGMWTGLGLLYKRGLGASWVCSAADGDGLTQGPRARGRSPPVHRRHFIDVLRAVD